MTQAIVSIIQEVWDTIRSIRLIEIPGIWGAIISTILACLKLQETWRERFQLSTAHNFSARDERGNEIIIQNPSKTPVMISHWKLLWRKRRWLKTETTELDYGYPEDRRDITIGAYETQTLTFDEQDYFDWDPKTVKKGKLYIWLRIVGRGKPVMLKVYDPSR